MTVLESVLNVLIVGLVFGAGLPVLYTVGIRCVAAGTADTAEDVAAGHTGNAGNPALRYLGYFIYALTTAIIFAAILWITRQTLYYYLDWQIFPEQFYKS